MRDLLVVILNQINAKVDDLDLGKNILDPDLIRIELEEDVHDLEDKFIVLLFLLEERGEDADYGSFLRYEKLNPLFLSYFQ